MRPSAPISDSTSWGGYWLSTATPPSWWRHRQRKVNIGYYDGAVNFVTFSALRTNAPFGGMNPLNNTCAWTDGAAPPGYNGGPAIAFWEKVRRIYNNLP